MIALDGYWEVKAGQMSQPRAQYTNGIYSTANGTPVRILDFIIVRVGAQPVRRVLNGQFLVAPTTAPSANFPPDPISSTSKSYFPMETVKTDCLHLFSAVVSFSLTNTLLSLLRFW